jgi:pilus assembly protein CpaE
VQLEDARLISADDVQRVIGLLKATFSHMIIDTSKSFSRLDMIAMEMADHVLLVTQLDLPCLRNVVRLLMSFEEMGKLTDKLKIVVNRVGRETGQISFKKAQETIGKEIFWQVPNDYRVMVEVRNNGVPLVEHAPRAAITQNICELAVRFAAQSEPAPGEGDEQGEGKAGRKWLSFMGRRG